jgi:hypothetical protein
MEVRVLRRVRRDGVGWKVDASRKEHDTEVHRVHTDLPAGPTHPARQAGVHRAKRKRSDLSVELFLSL